MPGSRERANARRRARRLVLQGDAALLASYFGVTRGTVLRWRRTKIPEARIEFLILQSPSKPARPVAVSYEARTTQRQTRIWQASSKGNVNSDAKAIETVSRLGKALSGRSYPKGATFQWVIDGVATHDYHQVMVGHYKPVELRSRGKKHRTKMVLPSKASGRLDVTLDSLLARLSHLEPFFKVESVKVIVRKAKG